MARPKKEQAGDEPKVIWPRWADARLVEAIAADVRDGVSEVAASLRAGLSRRTVSVWLSRWWAATDRSGADDEAKGPPEETAFILAVAPIARALGDWIADMERKAQAGGEGSGGAMWVLPRRVQDVYGNAQTVRLGQADEDPEKVVAEALANLQAAMTAPE